MKRDFMGSNSKDSEIAVKGDVEGGCKDLGLPRISGVPLPSSNQKFGNATIKPQFFGGNPQEMLPLSSSVAGTTEQWFNSKASGAPDQLTIFYAGTINVFDCISPEKAQAIMLLAGNICVPHTMGQSNHGPVPGRIQPQASQSMNLTLSSDLPSPISVTSYPIDQSGGAATKSGHGKVTETFARSFTPVNKTEPPRLVSSMQSAALTAMMSSAVPQSRKASLARFLKKRNERASSVAPYKIIKKENEVGTPESNGLDFSDTSSVGPSFMSTAVNA